MVMKLIRIGIVLLLTIAAIPSINWYKNRDRCHNCNLVIISLDTQRPDHMGIYGYERNTTPNIDAWARDGAMIYKNTYTETPMTYPSFASMMTGTYAVETGIFSNRVVTAPNGQTVASVSSPLIPNSIKTLAEILQEHSYKTVAFNSNPELSPEVSNINRGFDEFHESYKENYTDYEEKIVKKPIEFLKNNKDKKFFMWIHFIDPHTPYTPPGTFQCTFDKKYCDEIRRKKVWALEEERKELEGCKQAPISDDRLELYKSLYDDEVASNDAFVGKILKAIEREGLNKNTIVLLYSDHGEGFDHNYYFNHPGVLFNSTTKVVNILKNPNKKGGFYNTLTQNKDIFHTLLFQLGFEKKLQPKRSYAYGVTLTKNAYSVTDGQFKYMEFLPNTCNPTGEAEVLFDLKTDPFETKNVLLDNKEKANELKKALQAHKSKEKIQVNHSESTQNVNEELIDKIRNLGY